MKIYGKCVDWRQDILMRVEYVIGLSSEVHDGVFKLVFNNQIQSVLHFALEKSIMRRSCSFCDTASCRLMKAIRRFGETYSIHLHGRRVNEARKGHEADSKQRELRAAHYCCLPHSPLPLRPLLDRENGSSETPAVFPRTTRHYIPEVELFIAKAVIP